MDDSRSGGIGHASGMLALQRTHGNQYVQRLLSPAIARAARKVEGQPEEDVLENERPKREVRPRAAVAVVGRLAREALGRVRWIAREGDDTVPRGRAYDATRRAVDFVLKKPGPKRSDAKPSTTSTSMPTFKGAVAVDAAAKAWRFQVDSIQVQGQDQLPSLRSATSPGTRGSRLRWSEP